MTAILAFFIIVAPSVAGSAMSLLPHVTTPVLVELTLPHQYTQAEINVAVDLLAPEYGLSAKTVKAISKCEDQGNPYAIHHNSDEVLSTDHGPLQVNDYWHQDEVNKRGIDLDNPLQSLMYGMEIMSKQGTTPWNWSKGCWGPKV